jgi:hypothetical protein
MVVVIFDARTTLRMSPSFPDYLGDVAVNWRGIGYEPRPLRRGILR